MTSNASPRYVSLRWRLLFPLVAVILSIAIVGAYILSITLGLHYTQQETNTLLTMTDTTRTQLLALGEHHTREIFRLANTSGLRENMAARNTATLLALVEPNASLAELETVLVVANNGDALVAIEGDENGYHPLPQTDTAWITPLASVLNGEVTTAHFIAQPSQAPLIFTVMPIYTPADTVMGAIVIGTRLERVMADLEAATAFFATNGQVWLSNLPDTERLDKKTRQAVQRGQMVTETQRLHNGRYHIAYVPLALDNSPALGTVAVYLLSDTIFTNTSAQQMFSFLATTAAAALVITAYLGIGKMLERLEHIRSTAEALHHGNISARANLKTSDEIGQLAYALDQYADKMQIELENFQRYRRESARLISIIESLPDGLVITDLDGRVLMMNTQARELIGGISTWKAGQFAQLAAEFTDSLGPALAPGIFAYGKATRIPHQDHILQVQSAVVMSRTGKKLGLLFSLRDVGTEVKREQRFDSLLDELAQDVHLPIAHLAQNAALNAINTSATPNTLLAFARDIARNARSMQRIISELRDLNTFNPEDVRQGQRPILVNELLWQVAAQWKPSANAARLQLEIQTPPTACYVLGDDRRLRWALGNILDNAIKYSLQQRVVRVIGTEVEDGTIAHIRIQDEGVGISVDNLNHLFERFYRGQPTRPDGSLIEQPGSGQGLYLTRKVIEAHGGKIEIESTVGMGTTVHVYLPMTSPLPLEMPMMFDVSEQQQPVDRLSTR
ncbi:MAG: PAS domain-containing protein [Anaerolineales bacterium]|nr:PAS domain-containing protein [Anaerolineales bacterium]